MTKKEEIEQQKKMRESLEFDRLKMLFGEDYETKCGITLREPNVGEILKIGEKSFFEMLYVFIANPTQYRLPLWKMKIDWNKLTDFELFCILYGNIDSSICEIICPNIDFSSFKLYDEKKEESGEEIHHVVLYSRNHDIIIRLEDYIEISQYLRTLFNIFPKTERAKGKATKEAIIWEDEQIASKHKDKPYTSNLLPLVSASINHPGFKYNLSQLRDVGIYEFMDSVQRLQVYENTRAILTGSMSGFADMSKVSKENFNFMRDLSEKV